MSLVFKRFSYSVVFALCLLNLFSPQLIAQSTAKRALTAQDFDSWRSCKAQLFRAMANLWHL